MVGWRSEREAERKPLLGQQCRQLDLDCLKITSKRSLLVEGVQVLYCVEVVSLLVFLLEPSQPRFCFLLSPGVYLITDRGIDFLMHSFLAVSIGSHLFFYLQFFLCHVQFWNPPNSAFTFNTKGEAFFLGHLLNRDPKLHSWIIASIKNFMRKGIFEDVRNREYHVIRGHDTWCTAEIFAALFLNRHITSHILGLVLTAYNLSLPELLSWVSVSPYPTSWLPPGRSKWCCGKILFSMQSGYVL